MHKQNSQIDFLKASGLRGVSSIKGMSNAKKDEVIRRLWTENQNIPSLKEEIIQLKEQMAEAETAAAIDDLTFVHTHKFFETKLNDYFQKAKYHARRTDGETFEFAVVFLDLNDFKMLNTDLGYLQTNEVLKYFATAIQITERKDDIYARFGGDEFEILLAGVTKEFVEDFTARLEATNQNLSCTVEDGTIVRPRFSYGVILFDADKHGSPEDLTKDASAAMKAHKDLKEQIGNYSKHDKITSAPSSNPEPTI